jgi:hypothetical protein
MTHLKRFAMRVSAVPRLRLAKIAAMAVFGAYLLFLLVVNVVLETGLVARWVSKAKWVRNGPDVVLIRYDSAWSWWPGHVNAHGLRIRGADTLVEWQLVVDEVSFKVSWLALFHRQFRAWDIRANGVAARVRMKLDPAQATPEVVSCLPPIDGFADPPLKPEVPAPDIPDDQYKLWSVHLERIDAVNVRDVWFNSYRFVGDALFTANFMLRPLRLVMVGPVAAEVRSGEIRVGKETLGNGLKGHLDATVAPFDPRLVAGAEPMRFMTIVATGDGRVASLRFMNHYFAEPSQPKLDGGAGLAHVEVYILAGVLAPPTRATVDSQDASMSLAGHLGSVSAAHLVVTVEDAEGRSEGRASSDMTEVDVQRFGSDASLLHIAHANLVATSSKLDLVKPFEDIVVSANVPDAVMADMRQLDAYLGEKGPSIRAGEAHLQAKLSSALATHTARGELGVSATGLAVRDGDLEVRGTLAAALNIVALDYLAHHVDISGSRFEVRDVAVSGAEQDPRWWGRVELEHATLAYGEAPRFQASLAFQARDAHPILKAYSVKAPGFPSWAANRMTLEGVHGGAVVTLANAFIDVRALHVVGGAFDIRGELQKRGPTTNGAALVSSGPFALGIDLVNGSAGIRLIGATSWYERTAASPGIN